MKPSDAATVASRPLYYRLDGHDFRPISADELEAAFDDDRQVARDELDLDGADVLVSTIFMVIDHGMGRGEPVLFETMVFGGSDERQERYTTWDAAAEGHKRIVKELLEGKS